MDSIAATRAEIRRDQTATDMLFSSDARCEKATNKIVLWVFRDYDNQWCVRLEGGDTEVIFMTRDDALAFARELGAAAEGYCLFFQLADGRMSRELCNMQ